MKLVLFIFVLVFKLSTAQASGSFSEGLDFVTEEERAESQGTMGRPPRLKRAREFSEGSSTPVGKKIVVIGGGYTGILSAIFFGKLLKDSEIVLIEKARNLLKGASITPGRLHLGGEYPLDHRTSDACLYGACLFKQIFGDLAFTDIPAAHYLLAKDTPESTLTLDQQRKAYQRIVSNYAEIWRGLPEELRKENSLFGPPEELLRELEAKEMPSPHFKGGFEIKEPGLHPIKMAVILKNLLTHFGVKVMVDTEVVDVKKPPFSQYRLITTSGEVTAHYVINATFGNVYGLDSKAMAVEVPLSPEEGTASNPRHHIHTRAMLIAEIPGFDPSSETEVGAEEKEEEEEEEEEEGSAARVSDAKPPSIAHFALLDEHGGMVCPINRNGVVLLYWPSREGAHIDGTYLGGARMRTTPAILKKAFEAEKEEVTPGRLSAQILKNLTEKYPYLKGARPLRLVVRETLSEKKELRYRRPSPVRKVAEGWISALSTKATYAPIAAIEVLKIGLDDMGLLERGDDGPSLPKLPRRRALSAEEDTISEELKEFMRLFSGAPTSETVQLPTELHLENEIVAPRREELIEDAFVRELPISMALDASEGLLENKLDGIKLFLGTEPTALNLSGKNLTDAEKDLFIRYIGSAESRAHFLDLSYVIFSTSELLRLAEALRVNTSIKILNLRGIGSLPGSPLTSILEILKGKPIESLDLSRNNLSNQCLRERNGNLYAIYNFIKEAGEDLSSLVLREMALRDEDRGIIMQALFERRGRGLPHLDPDLEGNNTTLLYSGPPQSVSLRGLTAREGMQCSRELSIPMDSQAALAPESPRARRHSFD